MKIVIDLGSSVTVSEYLFRAIFRAETDSSQLYLGSHLQMFLKVFSVQVFWGRVSV